MPGGLAGLGALAGGAFQGYNEEQDASLKRALQQLAILSAQSQQQGDAAGWNALSGGFQPGGNTGYGPSAQGGGQGGPEGVVTQVESGNRNIPNTTEGTSSGQAQGYFQITTGTWNDFAPPEIKAKF